MQIDHDRVASTAEPFAPAVKQFVNWAAAILGVGTFAQIVPLVVGVLSAAWIAVQLYGYLRYELPAKRAKLRTLQEHGLATKPGDLQ